MSEHEACRCFGPEGAVRLVERLSHALAVQQIRMALLYAGDAGKPTIGSARVRSGARNGKVESG